MGEILDGKDAAREVRERVRIETVALTEQCGIVPGLATVLVGDDPASKIYVGSKRKACTEVGFQSFGHELPASTSEKNAASASRLASKRTH